MKGVTQHEIAIAAGITPGMLSLILNGKFKPGAKSILGLATALDIDPMRLLHGTAEEIGVIVREAMDRLYVSWKVV